MMTVRWGTAELVTALIILAPSLMIPRCSYVLPDHVAGGVLQEDQRRVVWLASRMNSVAFCDSSLKQHAAVVGQDADAEAVDRRPAGHQRRPVERLVLLEPRAVDDAGQHLARVERQPEVDRHDAEQLLRRRAPARRPACDGPGRACAS